MIDIGRGVKLIRRSEWGARAPRSMTGVNATFGTTAHWEGPHMGYPWAHAACYSLVRGIQNFHMDARGWTDVAYTGLPCPHGYVFEGRWAGRRTAANGTNDGNNRALALCYLGGQGDAFTADGQRAMRAAMDWLDTRGGAGPGRNGHRDWKPTECPGGVIYQWVHSGQQADGTPSVPEEDDMTPEQANQLKAIYDAVRDLRGRAPGYFAVPSSNSAVSFYVAADHSGKLRLERGGPVHAWIKGLHQISGFDADPVIMDPTVLDGIPDAA